MSALDRFLNAHGGMRKVSANSYRGPCRACAASERSGCLSISEGDTGALLVRCFKSECSPEAIALSVGLRLENLFPEKLAGHHVPGPRRRGLLRANVRISAHRGHPFQRNADSVSDERGHHFRLIADSVSN